MSCSCLACDEDKCPCMPNINSECCKDCDCGCNKEKEDGK